MRVLSQPRNFTGTSPAPCHSLPEVRCSYESFWAAAEEIGMSRIYSGIHLQPPNRDGLAAGKPLAEYVVADCLLPAR